MSDDAELRIAWTSIAPPSPRSDEVYEDLIGRHRQPHRRYHGVHHIVWTLRHIRRLEGGIDGCRSDPTYDPAAVAAAAFFHDAVYDPRADDNEERSAVFAGRELASLSWEADRCRLVGELIRATAGHHADSASLHRAVLVDADLAVLGAEPNAYTAYVNGVRSEYGHLSPDQWATGRRAVLRGFLDRAQLFATEPARAWWERQARANLTAELASLTGRG